MIIIPGSGKYQIQPIFVNDVANVIWKAVISKKFSNKILDLVGPEKVSFNEDDIVNKIQSALLDLRNKLVEINKEVSQLPSW